MRRIDADALKDAIYKDCIPYATGAIEREIGKVIDIINNQPTVDAKGHWIGEEYDGYADGYPVYDLWECSACGYEIEGDIDDLTLYCPHCGAYMSNEGGEK